MAGTRRLVPLSDPWDRVTVEMPVDPASASGLFGIVEVATP